MTAYFAADFTRSDDRTVIAISDGSGVFTPYPNRGERTVRYTGNPKTWSRLGTINWRKAKRLVRKGWAEIIV